MNAGELIWIQDAVKAYGRSRTWLDGHVRQSLLTQVTIAGDPRVYLKRAELEVLLRSREIRKGERRAPDTTDSAAG